MRSQKIKYIESILVLLIFLSTIIFARYAHAVEYSLEDLYVIALERAERIKILEEDLYIAERGRDKAVSALLPRLSAFGGYTKYSEKKFSPAGVVIQPENAALWGIRLDQSFSLSGREITALTLSSRSIEKSKYALFAAKESYLMSVALAYYDVLKTKKFLDIAKANVERLIKHRDAAYTRLKVGEVTRTALLRAEAELSGAASDLVRAENNLKLSKAVLSRVVGLYEEFDVKESPQFSVDGLKSYELNLLTPDCSKPAIDCLKQRAFTQRADLKSFETQKRISEKQVRYARGAYFPTVSIEGVWFRKDEDPASAFLNRESIYGGSQVELPIL